VPLAVVFEGKSTHPLTYLLIYAVHGFSLYLPVVIAFRVTDKLFFFGKEVPDRWVMVQKGTTKLGGLFLI